MTARLRDAGYRVLLVDGRAVTDKASALAAVRADAGFPDWVGSNLDALADALGDLSWLQPSADAGTVHVHGQNRDVPSGPLVLVWASAERLELLGVRDRNGLLTTLADAEAGSGPIRAVVLLDGPDVTGIG